MRYEELDIMRGVGIILVVLAHLNIPYELRVYIYSFHMPLFVFISGILFKENRKLIRILKSLIVPYFLYGICVLVMWYVWSDENFVSEFIDLLWGGCAPYHKVDIIPAVWFLPMLAVIQMIYKLVGKNYRVMSTFFYGYLGFFLSGYRELIPMLYNIDIAFVLYFFYVLGNVWEKREDKKAILENYLLVIVIAVIGMLCALYNGQVNIYRMIYGKSILLYYVAGISGIFVVVKFAYLLTKKDNIVKKILIYIGKRTMPILCTHQLIIEIVSIHIGGLEKLTYLESVIVCCGMIFLYCIFFETKKIIENKVKL